MKIQLALDLLDKRKALDIVKNTYQFVDIIEVGTSLLKLCGIQIIEDIRTIDKTKEIFVDCKIIDGPEREATLMEMAKVDYYSMLAVADDKAIATVLSIANKTKAKVVFDMQSVKDYKNRCIQLKQLGVEYLCVHKNSDCGTNLFNAFSEFEDIQKLSNLSMSLAGSVDAQSLVKIKQVLNPDIIVVGGAIINADDKLHAAQQFYRIAHQ